MSSYVTAATQDIEVWTQRTLHIAPRDWLVVASVIGLWACLLALLAVSSITQI